ncbi:probable ATP-dependent RNA helicase kurz [Toxorhynchites rutilus septentrionalis]|uniref:probable ATP-dependent RNA helicase kurz n=1 Tax=Toxorhynchites rutilus septentrionalis TaxID=329112 RepID=UPI002478D778|nr:probable ATP-dependent RNA helicase kurz [Toxorhynchites rutilus septentrionalis]
MGKRRFNEKGRQQNEIVIDNSATKQIKLDFTTEDGYGGTDDANLLVLPSKKRPTKIKQNKITVTRILSKKQRKRLEKVVDQKRKKENRSTLITALAKFQAPLTELKHYTKISSIQTKGLKQLFKEQKFGVTVISEPTAGEAKVKCLVGSRKQRIALMRAQASDDTDKDNDETSRDLNTLGVDDGSSSSEAEDEIDHKNHAPELENTVGVEIKAEVNNKSGPAAVQNKTEIEVHCQATDIVERSKNTQSVENTAKLSSKPAVYVHVERDSDVQAARLKLPILAEEQVIMEAINENPIVILAGETGSGKTTQVPQFLYEAGYAEPNRGIIAITEPRRVAAVSMSKRVGAEMNLSTDIVSYLIRFEGNVTDRTRIKFLTDGVLLKEIEKDFLLAAYSVVILDEAHERSIYTDILIGLLSRIVILRMRKGTPLKLIIMSATLRVKDFTENRTLFSKVPPVINIDSRQFPVTVHFSKTTAVNYVREAYLKTIKIHTKLPDGGILVFLTGQKEVNQMVKKLRKAFPFEESFDSESGKKCYVLAPIASDDEDETLACTVNRKKAAKIDSRKKRLAKQTQKQQIELPRINLDNYQLPWDDTEGDQRDVDDDDDCEYEEASGLDSDFDENLNTSELKGKQPLCVLPLYSILSSEKQQRVFEEPPGGTRLCVVATNVAETSLTIPGIKYVIDCGRQKTKLYDQVTGVTAFNVTYISKASANQRAGRAGRVAPGHCYRLYSSAVYNNEFEEFTTPEIMKKPVDDLMLQMKCMGIDKVINFPFPSPPDKLQLEIAEKHLVLMDALEEHIVNNKNKSQTLSRVTELGRTISAFPVAPRFGKMLALSHQQGLLAYTVCMVAALSVQEVLQEVSLSDDSDEHKKWRIKRKSWAKTGNSLLLGDPMILLRAVGAAEFSNSTGRMAEFCQENGLRLKAIKEIRKLRVQLTNEININLKDLNLSVDPKMPPPSDTQAKLLRQLVLIGMADKIARKIPDTEIKLNKDRIKYKHAYNLPDMENPVFVNSSSVLRRHNPEWICYQEVYETMEGGKSKIFLRGITAIEPEWLLQLVPNYCNIIKVLDEPEPWYDPANDSIMCHVQATVGKSGWQLPIAEIDMPKDEKRYLYFIKFFVYGTVYPKLARFAMHLLSSPDTILRSYLTSISRINALYKLFLKNEIFSKSRLDELWKIDQNFLLHEYQQLLPASCHDDVKNMWPPSRLK